MKQFKRFAAIWVALALAFGLCALPVWADDTTAPDTGTGGAAAESDTSGGVYVQAVTVTDLAGGEITTVNRGDTVNIVLRVVDYSSDYYSVDAGEIVTRINSSVFQYTGVGEISQLIETSDVAHPEAGAYYTYVLLFRNVTYAGGGNTLPIDLSYLDSSLPMQQFSVTIGQCVDKDPTTPGLVVRSSSYGSAAVVAGTPFTLDLSVYATSGTEALNDVIAAITLPKGITLTGGSLSTYIGTVAAHGTREVTFSVLPAANFTDGVANITVDLSGNGADSGTKASGTCTISVPVLQPDRFSVEKVEIPDDLTVGGDASVTVTFVNKGKNPVGNLEATISGNNLGSGNGQTQYIGNINAGTENSADFDITPDSAGTVSGTITLSYEADDGTIKTVTESFSGTATEPMPVEDFSGMEMDSTDAQTGGGLPLPIILGIVAAVLAVVVVVILVIRKKRKAKAYEELEDDESDESI